MLYPVGLQTILEKGWFLFFLLQIPLSVKPYSRVAGFI